MKLKRKQVYIDEESDSKLKALAVAAKTTEAEQIRQALKLYLSRKTISIHLRRGDPLLKLIGLCDKPTGPKDASIHHDQYLYGKKVNK